ncbi:hypothetical protein [Nocardia sp. NBC_01329]|uniref:hypothetical protein n=1 Tax=Nocardia sp. NBC_01329 TaxID=2903594 RepID=UPI002E11F0E7|nr:hypothetical protein OG405_18340 [Nocardia sp. NBC_01329]
MLRPGGRLLSADAHPSASMRTVFAWLDRIRRKDPRSTFGTTDIRRYSAALRECGFGEPEFVSIGHNTALLSATEPDDRAT